MFQCRVYTTYEYEYQLSLPCVVDWYSYEYE